MRTFYKFCCAGLFAALLVQSAAGDDASDEELRDAAATVMSALATRNGADLAAAASAERPVRFSPHAFVDLDEDVTLDQEEILRVFESEDVYDWGYREGLDPDIDEDATIRATAREYIEEFVLVTPCGANGILQINLDRRRTQGTTTQDNIDEIYPGSRVVEYLCIDGSESWKSSRLIFGKNSDKEFKLIAITRDERSF